MPLLYPFVSFLPQSGSPLWFILSPLNCSSKYFIFLFVISFSLSFNTLLGASFFFFFCTWMSCWLSRLIHLLKFIFKSHDFEPPNHLISHYIWFFFYDLICIFMFISFLWQISLSVIITQFLSLKLSLKDVPF